MTLFLDKTSNDATGKLLMSLPDCEGGYVLVEGFLHEEPSISLKNNWDSLIPDISSLSDFTTIAQLGSSSWLSTSKAAWKGTEPITIDLQFYLLTHRKAQLTSNNGEGPNMPITKQATYIAQLAAVSTAASDDGWFRHHLGVEIHGGYSPNYFLGNDSFEAPKNAKENPLIATKNTLNNLNTEIGGIDMQEGTIALVINGAGYNNLVLTKMLLEDVTFNPSTVRAGYWTTSNGNAKFVKSAEPLYIRVNMKLRLAHTAMVSDVARMFTGRSSL